MNIHKGRCCMCGGTYKLQQLDNSAYCNNHIPVMIDQIILDVLSGKTRVLAEDLPSMEMWQVPLHVRALLHYRTKKRWDPVRILRRLLQLEKDGFVQSTYKYGEGTSWSVV